MLSQYLLIHMLNKYELKVVTYLDICLVLYFVIGDLDSWNPNNEDIRQKCMITKVIVSIFNSESKKEAIFIQSHKTFLICPVLSFRYPFFKYHTFTFLHLYIYIIYSIFYLILYIFHFIQYL